METDLNNWDGFLGSNFLKAKDVTENDLFVVKNIELDTENDRPILVLEKDMKTFKFSLNVTNANFLKNSGLSTPQSAVGKKIWFKQNPTSKGLGLLITKFE